MSVDALLLIDLQEDFFSPPELARRRPGLVSAVWQWAEIAETAGADVIEVRTEVPDDPATWALNMREDRQPVALKGTPGSRRLDELTGLRVTETVTKRRDDAFVGTDLAHLLRSRGVEQIVIAGVSTEACIALTAAGAYARDLRVRIAGGAVASADQGAHEAALRWLEQQYRQSVSDPGSHALS